MTTNESHHQSYPPQAITSDGLMAQPISPDFQYPFPSDFLSPTENLPLQTPYFSQYPASECQVTRIQLSNQEDITGLDLQRELSGRPHRLSPTQSHKHAADLLTFPEMFSPLHFDTAGDHYGSTYSHGIHGFDDPALHETAPVHVVLGHLSNFTAHLPTGKVQPSLRLVLNTEATSYSSHFPPGHSLNSDFVRQYQLGDELGSGGYGFVMTALHRTEGYEVAIKFIIKKKVPEHAWVEDEAFGRLPTEVMLLSCVEHENIVKCLDLFEDSLYFYLVQELHGSPWPKHRPHLDSSASGSSFLVLSTPSLSPSISTTSLNSSRDNSSTFPLTPTEPCNTLPANTSQDGPTETPTIPQHEYSRRPSHDLFECIEQSENKRLSEKQARFVFSQIVDAIHYLDSNGIAHRDIKDENIVINKSLKVKLIDFGSASIVDPNEPRPYYTQFYGTTAYASPEILMKKDYQAAPAEIWTLGVLLSYLLTGTSPFPTLRDAINGRIVLADASGTRLSRSAMSLMKMCLDPNPRTRATIAEVRAHRWMV